MSAHKSGPGESRNTTKQ
jgi:hypothetical protein